MCVAGKNTGAMRDWAMSTKVDTSRYQWKATSISGLWPDTLSATRCAPISSCERRNGGGQAWGKRKRDRSGKRKRDRGSGSGTGPILLSQATFMLAHIANSGPVPLSAHPRYVWHAPDGLRAIAATGPGCVQAGAQKLGVIEASYASAIMGDHHTRNWKREKEKGQALRL